MGVEALPGCRECQPLDNYCGVNGKRRALGSTKIGAGAFQRFSTMVRFSCVSYENLFKDCDATEKFRPQREASIRTF